MALSQEGVKFSDFLSSLQIVEEDSVGSESKVPMNIGGNTKSYSARSIAGKNDVENEKKRAVEKESILQKKIDEIEPVIINGGSFTNAADNEDIESSNGLLKFKSRLSGVGQKGFCVIRRGKSIAEQIVNSDTIYEVRYPVDLDGESLSIPSDCTILFNGGSFSNGKIVFDNTLIVANSEGFFKEDIDIEGSIVNEVYPEMFEETEDWTNVFNKIFNIGSKVVLKEGKEYCTGGGENIIISNKDFVLEGNNALLKIKNYTGNASYGGAIYIKTEKTESFDVESISTAREGVGSIMVTNIVSVGSSFSVGDVVKIYSSDNPNIGNESPQYMGEYVTIVKISENEGKQTLKIQGLLYYNYSTNVKVAKLIKTGVKISDLKVVCENSVAAISIERLESPILENIQFYTCEKFPAIGVFGCHNAIIDKCSVNMVADGVAGLYPNTVGYGVNAACNQGLKVSNCTFGGLRHAYTTGSKNVENDWIGYGCERETHVVDCRADNCQLPFDSHPVGTDLTFSNCSANGGCMFQVRTPNTTIYNAKMKNGTLIYAAGCFDNLIVDGATVEELNYSGSASCTFTSENENKQNVFMKNLNVVSSSFAIAKNCSVFVSNSCIKTKGLLKGEAASSGGGVDISFEDSKLFPNNSSYAFGRIDSIILKSCIVEFLTNVVFARALSGDCNISFIGNVFKNEKASFLTIKNLFHTDSLEKIKVSYIKDNILVYSSAKVVNNDNSVEIANGNLDRLNDMSTFLTDNAIVRLPRYPSSATDYSASTISKNPLKDGIVVTFLNMNNFSHNMPTLSGVTKTIEPYGKAEMFYTIAGGWRWI